MIELESAISWTSIICILSLSGENGNLFWSEELVLKKCGMHYLIGCVIHIPTTASILDLTNASTVHLFGINDLLYASLV